VVTPGCLPTLFSIVLLLSLGACAVSDPRRALECSDDSQTTRGPTVPPPDSDGPMARLGGSYRKLQRPTYPPGALDAKVTGTVYVHVWVRPDGTVSDTAIAQVQPRSAVALEDGLAERIRTWRFNATEIHGKAVATEFIVPVRFSIKGRTPATATEPLAPHPANASVLETVTVEGE
jgi:TonB family protein